MEMTQRHQAQACLIDLMKALENDPDDAAMSLYIYSTLGRQMLLAIANDKESADEEIIHSIQIVTVKLKELLDKYKSFKIKRVEPTEAVGPMPVN